MCSNKDQQNFTSTIITAGLSSSVDISLNVENAADNAFQATLSFILPSNTLQLVNVFNQTRNGEVSVIKRDKLQISRIVCTKLYSCRQ